MNAQANQHPLNRHLFIADNLNLLRRLDNESIDLICIDPPFKKRRTFVGNIKPALTEAELATEIGMLADWGIPNEQQANAAGINWPTNAGEARFKDIWSYNTDVDEDWVIRIRRRNEALYQVIEAAKLASGMDTAAYLVYMAVRLIEMHRILKPTGSLYLHCDGDVNSYLRLTLDAVFGDNNRRSQIIWKRTTRGFKGSQFKPRTYNSNTDTILFYAKTADAFFDMSRVMEPYNSDYVAKAFKLKDSKGPYYLDVAHNRPGASPRPNLCYEYNGFFPPHPSGWKVGKARMNELEQDGELVVRGNRLYRKIRPKAGRIRNNLWEDINEAGGTEDTGYPTQKPTELAERIIKASSNPGDVVLDCFAGCAYVPVAAERNGRQWIACDISPRALTVLRRQFAKFRYAVDGQQQVEQPALLTEANIITAGPYSLPERTDNDPEPSVDMKELPPVAYRTPASIIPEPEMLRMLLELSDYKAWCCGFANRRPDGSIINTTRNFHLDHRDPKSKEGTSNQITNRAPMCPHHNIRKNNRRVHLAEYRQEISDAKELMVDNLSELVNLTWAGDQALEIYTQARMHQSN